MLMNDANATSAEPGLPLAVAADLQDHLLIASHDLERLQTLLSDACTALMASFHGVTERLQTLQALQGQGLPAGHALPNAAMVPVVAQQALQELRGAVTALQFEDMASQLITHTSRRLRNCCDRLAAQAMGDDGEGDAIVEEAPLRPNPVTQDEMDAGSIELF